MDDEYWLKKWERGETRFHRIDVHPALLAYSERLPKGRTLVPLCGKSRDLAYLETQGHDVVGVELSELACRQYFAEQGQIPDERHEDGFLVLKAGSVELWCGDFFRFPGTGFSAIYDRAALVALPDEPRRRYAERLDAEVYLLVTFEFDPASAKGPPFPIFEEQVRSLFSQRYSIECLRRGRDPFMSDHPKFVEAPPPTEAVYWMQRL